MAEPVDPGTANVIGLGTGRTWIDRIREAAYTSPSGLRIKIQYEDVSRSFEKRGTVWEFGGVDGAYVQQKGFGARRYPLACIFSGPDHDRVATAFEAALLEPGIGTLEHPRYGKIDVVPFGDITRRDDLKSAGNQSIIEVTFWTTLKELYPKAGTSLENEVLSALDTFNDQVSQEFGETMNLATAANRANSKATIKSLLREVSAALRTASETTAAVRRGFDDDYRAINDGMDVLIGQPVLLAQQIANLIQAPARAEAGILSRLEGYASLAERILDTKAARPSLRTVAALASGLTRIRNDFHAADLMALNAVAGSVLSVVENQFTTKPQVLEAAEEVLGQFDAIVNWRDVEIGAIGQVDTGGSYQALQASVALVVGFLIEISFTLVPERRIVLDRARTIVDLAAELYGSVDDRLDELINTNDLSGSEILELPRGRSIVYYPNP